MTPNSGAGAGEDKAVSGDIVTLIITENNICNE